MGILSFRAFFKAWSPCVVHVTVALVALSAALPEQAWGTESDAFVRLIWIRGVQADSCPGQLEVERQVRWRLGRDPFVLDATRMIEARVSLADGIWHVELSVHDNTGASLGQRLLDVRADNCGQVVDAVGLAVALAIDPNISLESSVPPLAGSEPPSSTGPTAAPPQPAAESRVLWPYSQLTPIAAAQSQLNRIDKTRYQYELTLRGLGAAGLIPGFAPGVAVAGAFGASGIRLTLGLSYLPETKLDSFAFGLTTAEVGICGDIIRSRLVAGSICGELQVGAIHAVVYQPQPVSPGDQVFVALGLGPKMGWHAWAPFFIEGGVTAVLGLRRPQFDIHEDVGARKFVFQSQPVSGVGFVGVGVTAP